ncbi:hypothetical protein H6F89_33505 [Cyanobacteria bacterium FACHB-63]|nr:hypothetical protein [Cyanobacteria bacterium FACHB-63]
MIKGNNTLLIIDATRTDASQLQQVLSKQKRPSIAINSNRPDAIDQILNALQEEG